MASGSSELVVRLDTALPARLPTGRGTAVFCNGACYHPRLEAVRGWLHAGGQTFEPAIWRAPRPDLVRALREPRAYRSGFWATLPLASQPAAGRLDIELTVELADGRRERDRLGTVEIVAEPEPAAGRSGAEILVCMATHDPDPGLLAGQIESLRAQTETGWHCLIRDDCSSDRRFAELSALVAGDGRFSVLRGERPLGPYRNFERLLAGLPAGPSLIALCDQDDRWHPEKLSVLRAQLKDAQLSYCDQRVVDADGRVLSPSMWGRRGNQWRDLACLVIANSVTGSAALMRREVVEMALPFPEVPGILLHDHWLAAVALATGRISYVDQPLSDYVQHADAVLGRVHSSAREGSCPGARATYFYGFVSRQVLAQALLARCADRMDPRQRRALVRLTSGDASPRGFAWLWLHGMRHRRHTLGTEFELARGILWRGLVPLIAGLPLPRRLRRFDASCPAPTPRTLGMGRLARWRAEM